MHPKREDKKQPTRSLRVLPVAFWENIGAQVRVSKNTACHNLILYVILVLVTTSVSFSPFQLYIHYCAIIVYLQTRNFPSFLVWRCRALKASRQETKDSPSEAYWSYSSFPNRLSLNEHSKNIIKCIFFVFLISFRLILSEERRM